LASSRRRISNSFAHSKTTSRARFESEVFAYVELAMYLAMDT